MTFEQAYQSAQDTYRSRTPKSAAYYEEACRYMPGGETRSIAFFEPYPFTVERGEGCRYYDLDGNVYIDFLSNYTSLIHGHGHPALVQAMCDAARKGTAAPAGIPEQLELAKRIVDRVPSVDLIRFCNSGTEATMFAIRAAKAYTGRDAMIKMLGGYHGTHDAVEFSVSPTLEAQTTRGQETAAIADQKGIPQNVADNLHIAPYNDLAAVESILKAHHQDIACILVEPFLGTTGMIPANPGYLKGLRQLADQYGVLFIMDEVQGFRLSTGGAQKKFGVNADLCSFGKFIGGGLAVGAFGGRRDIMELYSQTSSAPLNQSGTFNGNRPTMAAGSVSLKLLDQAAIDYIDSLGARLQFGMEAAIAKKGLPVCVTSEGSLLNIHMCAEKPYDYDTAARARTPASKLWFLEMLNRGIFLAHRGLFVISTVMTETEIDLAVKAFEESLDVIAPYL